MGTEQRNEVIVRCDFSGCSTVLRWIQQEVQVNPDALPDAAWRLLTFATFDGAVKGFCSKVCLLSYLRDFVPLKSPKEQKEIAEAEKLLAEQSSKLGLVLPGAVQNPTLKAAVEQTLAGSEIDLGGVHIPDATGDSTEAVA